MKYLGVILMKEVEFKVGDLVYCPAINNKISKITKESEESYIFLSNAGWFKNTGLNQNGMPVIFHATQENYELLSKLYPNVTFEPPPKHKEPREIIEAMLDFGYHGVLCEIEMVDEDDDSIVRCYRYDYVREVLDDKIIFSNSEIDNDNLKFVSPFHQKHEMRIIDFIDGRCVLENGEVVG